MHLAAPSHQRDRHHGRAHRQVLLGLWTVLGDLAVELVAEDDLLVRTHEVVVAGSRMVSASSSP